MPRDANTHTNTHTYTHTNNVGSMRSKIQAHLHLSTHKSLYCEWIYTYNTKAWPICVLLSLFFLSLQHRAKRRALLEHGASDIVVASCSRRHPCASCEYSVCSVHHAACSMQHVFNVGSGAPSVCACALLWFRGGNRIPYTVYGIVIRGI